MVGARPYDVVVVRVRVAERRVVHGVVGQRRAVEGDPSVAHHHGPVDQLGQRPELVGHQHDRGAAALQLGQRLGERQLVGQVDARGRLVEEEQVGLAGQGAGDQHPLLLPAGQLGDPVGVPVGQPDDLDGVADRGPVGAGQRPEQAPAAEPAGGDHLPHRRGYAGGGRAALRDEPDPVPVVEPVQGRAEQLRRAAGERPAARSAPRTRVDLPEPLAPIRATNSPSSTRRSIARSTGRPPIATVRSRASITDIRWPSPAPPGSAPSGKGSPRRPCRRSGPRSGRGSRCSTPASSARVSLSSGGASVSEKTVVMPSCSISSCSSARSAGVGSASGESPAIGAMWTPYRLR